VLEDGFVIGRDQKLQRLNALAYASQEGFEIIRTEPDDAIEHEGCNILPLGDNTFATFFIQPEIKKMVEAHTGAKIIELGGDEICKAAGGLHCLTRPVFL
jgi:N-dimethylarginine dimethylaminohydrolase